MYSERLRQLEEASKRTESAPKPQGSSAEVKDVIDESYSSKDSIYPNAFGYEFAGLGIGIASMAAEVLLSHPFVVLRGQCQVRSSGGCLHLLPFSLLPVVSTFVHAQGIGCLWKGLGSVFIVRGLCLLSENIIGEVTSLPKEVSRLSSLRRITGHLVLKTLSWIVVTPFYASSIVELVQSDKASEATTLISCLRDGFCRLFHMPSSPRLGSNGKMFRSGPPLRSVPITTSRLLPIWRLIPPVVLLNIGHYVVHAVSCVLAEVYWDGNEDRLERDAELDLTLKTGGLNPNRRRMKSGGEELPSSDQITLAHQRQETALQTMYNRYYTDLVIALTANLVADIITYPLETLVIRLCVQGTRTLVDNMDTGDSVVPIVSIYDGFGDALRSALDSSTGFIGLYRGFGALIAQYALQAAFLYGVRVAYQKVLYLWFPSPFIVGDNKSYRSGYESDAMDS